MRHIKELRARRDHKLTPGLAEQSRIYPLMRLADPKRVIVHIGGGGRIPVVHGGLARKTLGLSERAEIVVVQVDVVET